MTDTIRARGEAPRFLSGSLTFENQPYILTSTWDQIHLLRTRRAADRFDDRLEFSGRISIYDLSPVEIQVTPGYTDVGYNGRVNFATVPHGAFEDFAIFPSRDPVDGFIESDNSGTGSGAVGAGWTRHKRVVVPPKRTRFVVPRVRLSSVPAGQAQYLDAFQTEVLPLSATDVTDYQSPRSLSIVVRPDRINLSENPSGGYNTEAWFGVRQVEGGLEADGPAHHYVRGLKPGEWYIKSAFTDAPQTVTLDGKEQFAEQAGVVRRLWSLFQATEDWASLDFNSTGTYKVYGAMVEPSRVLRPYFDGDSGDDYLWEQGKPAGAGRSYYYARRAQRNYILRRTLQENVPIGVSVMDPIYGQGTEVSKSHGFGVGAYGLTVYGE